MDLTEYYVINRSGERIPLDFNKILLRLTTLKKINPELRVNIGLIAQNTIKLMANDITTIELDNISANFCASMITTHPDYGTLAARIEIDNLHRETLNDYYQTVLNINDYIINGYKNTILDEKLIKFVEKYKNEINKIINYQNDYNFTYFGIKTLKKSYLLKHIINNTNKILERPQHMWIRVSIGINLNKINEDGTTDDITLNEIFETYDQLSNNYYIHATPTLFNAGTKRQSLSSCFLLNVDDDLDGIYKTLSDTAKISKWSGGIGIHVSQVRAKDSIIHSTNGKSEGIVPMLKVYNDSALYVSQGGGKRRGSTAVYLEPWHADIEGFLDLKKPIGDEMLRARDLFLALWISDLFMKRLEKAIKTNEEVMWSLFCPNKAKGLSDVYGEDFEKLYIDYENKKIYNKQISIIKLWKHILEIQMESGNPYIMFKDAVNSKNNQNNLGTIKSSNLCVKGDTLILTKDGYYPIKDLANKDVEIWDTKNFTLSPVRKTGENQQLLRITTDDGCVLECTKYHKFNILKGKGESIQRNYKNTIVEAQNLKINDILYKCEFPVIEGNKNLDFESPYTHGMYCGDGSNYKLKNSIQPFIDLYHGKQELLQYLDYDRVLTHDKTKNSTRIILNKSLNSKFDVPINASLDNKLKWLAGYIDADGCFIISTKNKIHSIQISSINKDFLYKVKLLCNTLGINPKLKLNRKESEQLMPDNKGLGGQELYKRKLLYRLNFTSYDTYKLYNDLQLKTYRLIYNFNKSISNTTRFVRVQCIEEVKGLHDTYCFKSKNTSMGIFNGIPTFQCAEINIYTDKDNIGVCNLASISLPKFVEIDKNGNAFYNYTKLYETVRIATRNLNKVIDNNVYPVQEGQYSDSKNRPIAVGVQGLADVFFKLKLPFTSNEAKKVNKLISETLYFASLSESNDIAKKLNKTYETYSTSMSQRGILQYDLWNITPSKLWNWEELKFKIKSFGLYNSLLIALMPTASTSQILGNYEMFEPITSNMFIRSTLSGTFQIINKYLINDLIELNLWNDKIKQQIIAYDGSIQNIQEIPKHIKEIYKTIWELKQRDLIDMDADRGAYICHSSSSNRYVKNPTDNKLTSMHIYSWKAGLKTGCYYLRTQSDVNAVKFNVDVKILKQMKLDKDAKKVENDECLVCSA